jgi:predicted ATPase
VRVELVHVDLELRLKGGEPARVEEYLARYPSLAADRAAVVDLILTEHEVRRRREAGLSLDNYLARFPDYQVDIWERLAPATAVGSAAWRDTPEPGARGERDPAPQVEGYETLASLGRGGMGVVYKARQLSLNRLVALKFLPPESARDPVWLERFRREAVTASALNHPNICTIYDTGESGGRPFISMELVQGRTLTSLVDQRLPVQELAGLLAQAAGALAAAHATGVVHRDIKPENLMVRDDGIVKVLDFGLARRVPTAPTAGPRPGTGTDPGTRVGTVLYMSPEQARAEPVGTASDIFSLGIVLYELATGAHPFPGDSWIGVLHAITDQLPRPPEHLNPEMSPDLAGLIERMLAKDARFRPPALEVEAALQKLVSQRPRALTDTPPRHCQRPLVGRSRERAALDEAMASASASRGLVVCVTGQPGLGKTTLVEQFLDDLTAGRDVSVARGRCSERLAGAEAYLPFLEALGSLLHGDRRTWMVLMETVAPMWFAQVAPAGAPVSPERLVEKAKASSPERMKRELITLLQEGARLRPLVLWFDDVHWADASTVDLLAYIGARCADLRLLVVATYRPTEMVLNQQPFLAAQLELQHHGVCRAIALGLLQPADVDAYLTLAFAGHQFPPELADLVHRQTEGNPLFLVDLLRYLRDRGVITQTPDGWSLTRALADLQPELPESVRSMIRKKIALLGKSELRLLSAAAVQGNEFDTAVVARVLRLDPARVEERLELLDRVHGLVRLRQEQELPGGVLSLRYQFVHLLYQNILYAALPPNRTAAWSGAAARALLELRPDQAAALAGELALLFEAAGEVEAATHHFLRAAEHAVGVFAYQEAAGLAQRGLALLPRLADPPTRHARELALRLALGVSLVATLGFASPEVENTYLRARELCRRAEDTPTLCPVLYGLWNVYLVRGELARCLELARQMLALAESQPDPVYLLVAHNVLQQPLFHMGDLAAARRHQEQGLALYDVGRHRGLTAVYGEDPGVGCRVYGAATLWHLGFPEQAVQAARAGRRLAEDLGSPFNVAQALYYQAFTHLCRREPERVQELAAALMELCGEEDFALLLAGGLVFHGWSLAMQGPVAEGIGQVGEGLARWHATGALSHRPQHLALLAEILSLVGRVAEGLQALEEARVLTEATGERFAEAEICRLRGEFLRQEGPAGAADAETCFREALAVARQQQAKSLELRAATSWAHLLHDQGRAEEGRGVLAEVYGWFTEGWDTPDLRRARDWLGRPSEPEA